MKRDSYWIFQQFSCGCEYFFERVGGVGDWDNCICGHCQPYHGFMKIDHACRYCGGSFEFKLYTPQTRLSSREALEHMKTGCPMFNEIFKFEIN